MALRSSLVAHLMLVVDLMIASIGIFFNGIYDFYDMDGRMRCNEGTSW